MTVTDVKQDPEAHRITITSEFQASIDQGWEMWSDPRKLERWWGPPGYPATFVDHDLTPGGRASYYMTSPEHEHYYGWWQVNAVDAPKRISFEDGFADSEGKPNPSMPTSTVEVTFEEVSPGRVRMSIESTSATREDMEKLVEMGAIEGMSAALAQIDDLLAA